MLRTSIKSKGPNLKKPSPINLPTPLPNGIPPTEDQIVQIILDLLARTNSPNEIADHLKMVYNHNISLAKVRQILFTWSEKIQAVNWKLTSRLVTQIEFIESDEIHQGQQGAILVLVDKPSRYMIAVIYIKAKTAAVIIEALQPWKALLVKIKVVFTDGASFYPEVLRVLCPNAVHQTCLIHILRTMLKTMTEDRHGSEASQEALEKAKEKQRKFRLITRERQGKLKRLKQQEKYHLAKREGYREQHHIQPYQKGILQDHPELVCTNEKLNSIRSSIRSRIQTLQNSHQKARDLKTLCDQAMHQKNSTWNTFMSDWKLLQEFYSLFLLTDDTFQIHFDALKSRVANSTRVFPQKVWHIMEETVDLTALRSQATEMKIPRSWLNTNIVESRNSILRSFLECLRNCKAGEYTTCRLALLQLRQNLHCPFSGPYKDLSPVERLGYDLKGRTYLDLIFNGLPPGLQRWKNLLDPKSRKARRTGAKRLHFQGKAKKTQNLVDREKESNRDLIEKRGLVEVSL